jgi:hypothetical protein
MKIELTAKVLAYPMNGLAVYTIIGRLNSAFVYISPTVPPATERNAEPARPSKKRDTNMVAMFFATAHGTIQIRKQA